MNHLPLTAPNTVDLTPALMLEWVSYFELIPKYRPQEGLPMDTLESGPVRIAQ